MIYIYMNSRRGFRIDLFSTRNGHVNVNWYREEWNGMERTKEINERSLGGERKMSGYTDRIGIVGREHFHIQKEYRGWKRLIWGQFVESDQYFFETIYLLFVGSLEVFFWLGVPEVEVEVSWVAGCVKEKCSGSVSSSVMLMILKWGRCTIYSLSHSHQNVNWIMSRWGPKSQLGLWYSLDGAFEEVGAAMSFVASSILAQISPPVGAWVSVLFALVATLCAFGIGASDYILSRRHNIHEVEKKMKWAHLKMIQPSVWIVFGILFTFTSNYQTFLNVASDLFEETRQRYFPEVASRIVSIGLFVHVFLRPYFGWFSGRHGSALYLITIGSIMLCLTYLIFLGNVFGMLRCFVSYSSLSPEMISNLYLYFHPSLWISFKTLQIFGCSIQFLPCFFLRSPLLLYLQVSIRSQRATFPHVFFHWPLGFCLHRGLILSIWCQ